MDPSGRFLTPDDVMERARTMGLELTRRTLKYYVSIGLVPEPVHDPFPQADKRIAWFASSVVPRLRRVQSLKAQGFSLAQIQKLLGHKAGDSLRRYVEQQEQDQGTRPARRLLRVLASDEFDTLENECRALVRWDPRDESLMQHARQYYEGMVSLLFGAEERVAVEQFFATASARERDRLLLPVRGWRDGRGSEDTSAGLFHLIRTLAGALSFGHVDRTHAEKVVDTAVAQVLSIAERYRNVRQHPAEEDVRGSVLAGLEAYLEALNLLRQTATARSTRQVLVAARRGRDILQEASALARHRSRLTVLLGDTAVP